MDKVISHAIRVELGKVTIIQRSTDDDIRVNEYSLYALYVLDELSKVIGSKLSEILFVQKCKMFKISPETFNKNHLTDEFLLSVCNTYSLIATRDKIEILKDRIKSLIKS